MRVMSPARGCLQVDGLSGRRYTARDGSYDMTPGDAKALVQVGGFLPSAIGTTNRSLGFRCSGCGFGTFVKICSRCGGECEKE